MNKFLINHPSRMYIYWSILASHATVPFAPLCFFYVFICYISPPFFKTNLFRVLVTCVAQGSIPYLQDERINWRPIIFSNEKTDQGKVDMYLCLQLVYCTLYTQQCDKGHRPRKSLNLSSSVCVSADSEASSLYTRTSHSNK